MLLFNCIPFSIIFKHSFKDIEEIIKLINKIGLEIPESASLTIELFINDEQRKEE